MLVNLIPALQPIHPLQRNSALTDTADTFVSAHFVFKYQQETVRKKDQSSILLSPPYIEGRFVEMITLYDYLPSQNAYKIRLLLQQLNIPYQTEIISIFEGEGQHQDYLKINPTGAVPAIRLEDGRTIAESNAILVYLAEDTPYLPTDTFHRAIVLQWLFFEGETVQATVATLRHWVLTGKDKNRRAEVLHSKRVGSLKALGILDDELARNKYLGGSDYTIADISVFAYVHKADEADLPLSSYKNIVRWIADIKSRDGFLDKAYPYSIDPNSTSELP